MFRLETLLFDWKNEQVIDVYKPFGMTPKDIADEVKKITNANKTAFAGRLDPMAHGLIRIFLNDACKLANKTNICNKQYKFKFAFHVSTSSGDLLGRGKIFKPTKILVLEKIITFLNHLRESIYLQKVPIYSSLPLTNKKGEKYPLWKWAKQNRLSEVEIPCIARTLYSFELIGFGRMHVSELCLIAIDRITQISPSHDFNQKEIINQWTQIKNTDDEMINTFEMTATVSSGFYVRQLVTDIGEYLGIPTTTIEIERLAYC